MTAQYNEPEKQAIRERILTDAIRRVTKFRARETLVTEDYFRYLWDYCVNERLPLIGVRIENSDLVERWADFYKSRNPTKSPSQVKVVYLCGPQPTNDLRVLLKSGLAIENIWAVESGQREFTAAVQELRNSYPLLKISDSSLPDFLAQVAETFDIIYLDSTAPFLSPSTYKLVDAVFRLQKLADLGVLITTFASLDERNPKQLDQYINLMSCYYFARQWPPANREL